MSMLIATEDGGPQRGIPFSVPYTSIDYITMEEVNDEYTVVVYTVTGTRKALKQKFSLNRVVELMVRIGKQMEKGAVLDLVDLTGPDDS